MHDELEQAIARLNPMQQAAVLHKDGPLLILAGAGSGKTSVLTHRIARLILDGVAPFQILAITFTNKAAKEMRERVNRLAPKGDQVWVSTFHSMCVRILRREIHALGYDRSFGIYDADDSERLMKRCMRELNINDKLLPVKSIMSQIGGFKDELIGPDTAMAEFAADFRQKQICAAYKLYQGRLRENNALDFDDLIFKTVDLFRQNPDVLAAYQNRFRYILVDEYQDTNTSQYILVKMLAAGHRNLCVVGDDDQSIYGWRGANIRNILDFEKDNPNTSVIRLEQNYRSTQVILDAANAVIQNNRGRKGKTLWTNQAGGEPIYVYKAMYDYEEGRFVAEKIKAYMEAGGKYADHAVLYRTNAQSRAIEEQLVARGMPYRIFGGVRFYDRKEIKDVLAYLRVLNNPKDGVSLARIINVPRRGIGDSSVDKLAEYAALSELSLYDALKDVEDIPGIPGKGKKLAAFRDMMEAFRAFAQSQTITEVVERVLQETNYLGELLAEGTVEAMGRAENVQELQSKAAEFEENAEDKSLTAFLEELALVADIDNYTDDDDTIVLMTLHSSKGLEFPRVFIVGLEEGIFPSFRSVTSGDIKDLEEERRICYVGITRAKEVLYVSAAASRRQHGQIVYNAPSRFLKEIPEGLVEQVQLPVEDKGKKERTGISQFAEINKVRNAIDISFGGKNYAAPNPEAEKTTSLDFGVGDKVRQMKYGVGVVKDIRAAGPDYEVTVAFDGVGEKKFMAHLSKLKKV